MAEPGLDHRHRDNKAVKAGEIRRKRSDTPCETLPNHLLILSPAVIRELNQ
jgi:hypothetical protein